MSFSDSSMEYASVVTMGTINMRSSIIDPCPTEEAAWVKKGALQPTEGLTVGERIYLPSTYWLRERIRHYCELESK